MDLIGSDYFTCYFPNNNKKLKYKLESGKFFPLLNGSFHLLESINQKLFNNSEEDNYAFNLFYEDFFKSSFLKKFKTPVIFLSDIHFKSYKYLENIDLSHQERDFLDKNNVNFFLFEPLLDVFCINSSTETLTEQSNVLSCLNFFAKKYNLKFNVHMCESNISKYNHFFTNLNLINLDIFLQFVSYKIDTKSEIPLKNKIEKKFFCPNIRYKHFRYYIVKYLLSKYETTSYISWPRYATNHLENYSFLSEKLESEEPFLTFLFKKNKHYFKNIVNGFFKLKQKGPLFFDSDVCFQDTIYTDDIVGIDSIKNVLYSKEFLNYLDSSFCPIVCETAFDYHSPLVSEKTFLCFARKKPFIMVGCKDNLKYLKSLGFKTFSKFWDESYDEETSSNERLYKIFELIENLNNKTDGELNQITFDLTDILEYNYNHVKTFYKF